MTNAMHRDSRRTQRFGLACLLRQLPGARARFKQVLQSDILVGQGVERWAEWQRNRCSVLWFLGNSQTAK